MKFKVNCLKSALRYVIFLSLVFFNHVNVYAGIQTTFADLILENLEIGGSYNLRALRNCPLIIYNKGGVPENIKIEVDKPNKDSLKVGYDAIPDNEWIQIVPNKYTLGPGERGSSDVIITIPQDEKLAGKHFQAVLLCSSLPVGLPGAGLTIATGTQIRVRFSIGTMGPDYLKAEKKLKRMQTLNFEIDPMNIRVKDVVELGKKINLRKEKDIKLNLINRATESVKLNMIVVDDKSIYNDNEYENGNPKFLEIKPNKVNLEGESFFKLDVFLKIPDEEKYKNKKMVFIVKAEVEGAVPVEVYTKIFVTTSE
ncbi:MAG: hypothetical protein A2474_04910 [Elusimicrobia bacterium RIFOXYC2_FULL_34_12]|nr:MAG: hypothetical protein A2474_04910 [Elusimicrobia bacterium RIFOXYC2_FULL_34_12]